jgi:circadian clock protein KaiC
MITAERTKEYGEISRFGVEEFVADNVILLRNVLQDEKRRRTIEILKFRGTSHFKGEHPYSIIPDQGITAIPVSTIKLNQASSNKRIHSGIKELDNMCHGGFLQDSIVLVSGSTGTGKTLMAMMFMAEGVARGERCLMFSFEESRKQLIRNAAGWGVDFENMEKEGKLKLICEYPESVGLEEHLISMRANIEEFKPNRIVIDSLSAIERISTLKCFREFLISLTSFIKSEQIVGFFTSVTPTLFGGGSVTEAHISTLTDSIILLRYVEIYGEMHRSINILKMRGSKHDKSIREAIVDEKGMHIGKTFHNVSGILTGQLTYATQEETERIDEMFRESK